MITPKQSQHPQFSWVGFILNGGDVARVIITELVPVITITVPNAQR